MEKDRRQLSHERSITYRSFERDDGLFEIEGSLRDTKGYDYIDRERGTLPVGAPVHDIFARIVIDSEMTVHNFVYEL